MTWSKDTERKYGKAAKAKRSGQNVQPTCGQTAVSDCQYFCFSLAPPAVQRGVILSICGAAGSLDRGEGTHKHKEQKHKQTLIPEHYALSFFLAHALSSIHKHSPTHWGHFIAAEWGRSWRIDCPAEWDWGYSGMPEMMETNKMADH